MTKMKSKKMTKSTFAIIIMAVIMVAMLAFGGTYAYFTASSGAKTGSVTTGTLNIGGTLTFSASDDSLVPNQVVTIGDMSTVTVTGTTVAAYRVKFEITSIMDGSDDVTEAKKAKFSIDILDDSNKTLLVGATENAAAELTWTKHTDNYYYYKYAKTGTNDENDVGLGGTLNTILPQLTIKLDSSADDTYQGLTVNYTITIQAAQAEYIASSTEAGYTNGAEIPVATAAAWTHWGESNVASTGSSEG